MNNFWKSILTAVIVLIIFSVGWALFVGGMGNWFAHTSIVNIGLMSLCIIVIVYLAYHGIKAIWTQLALCFVVAAILGGCSYAKSNQQVVVSDDCGMSWQKIKAGDAVPKAGMNMCYMKVVMPNFPMQGESRFIANLKGRVRAAVHIDYDYSIIDPLAFIIQAKYLGKANSDADSGDALDASAFEGAENMVIDKRVRDVSKEKFLEVDIVEFDQADLENDLHEASNKILEEFGVRLNFITLTFELDDQTRQAIDVATAMKIYQSKGIVDLGEKVTAARAGAPKITIEVPQQKIGE